jgi:16S rRNA (cytidine1402-2'-O)-methyltransferase
VVSTPIGNPDDLTLRARRVLGEVDIVIVEERRAGSTLLKQLGIMRSLVELNEHSTPEETGALVEELRGGANLALISDHGTPLVQDPGHDLVRAAIRAGARVEPVPGASSILAALVASGLPAPRFRFVGQLPPKAEARQQALVDLAAATETLVLVDAPYRLSPLLRALSETLGGERRAVVAQNLTMPDERFDRGTLQELVNRFTQVPFKGEFVIVVEGARASPKSRKNVLSH